MTGVQTCALPICVHRNSDANVLILKRLEVQSAVEVSSIEGSKIGRRRCQKPPQDGPPIESRDLGERERTRDSRRHRSVPAADRRRLRSRFTPVAFEFGRAIPCRTGANGRTGLIAVGSRCIAALPGTDISGRCLEKVEIDGLVLLIVRLEKGEHFFHAEVLEGNVTESAVR